MPLFYYVYKFGTPEFGGLDVYSYYKLYENWDFAAVDSPFNQRLISSFAIYLIHLSGINYNTETAIQALGLNPQVYFSAVLFNFISVILTCLVIYNTIQKFITKDKLVSFIGGLLFLLGFGTLFFLISALTDAFSVLLVALAYYFYLSKSRFIHLVFILAVFQREYVFFVFGLMALIHAVFNPQIRRYAIEVIISSVVCFFIYFICRKTIFYTPRYEHQIDISRFLDTIKHGISDFPAYIRQTLLLQNILFLYFAVIGYKFVKRIKTDRIALLVILMLFFEIVGMSVIVGLGNNTGRYFYMVVPIIIVQIVTEALPLIGIQNNIQITSRESGSV